MTKEIEIAGPVMLPAVDAVIVKMPAPMTIDTPKTVRSHQFRSLRRRVSGSSVSAMDCSTDFVLRVIGFSFRGLWLECTEYCAPDGAEL